MLYSSPAYISISNSLIWIFLFTAITLLILFLKDVKGGNKKVIFFGDSLTEYGVLQSGYIYLMKRMLMQQHINKYDLIGAGVSGDKIGDLQARLTTDVIAQSADIVVIWIGVNDVWHKYTHGYDANAEVFEEAYRNIIKELLADKIKIMVVTPGVIGEKKDKLNIADDELDVYAQIIRKIAKEFELSLCDMRASFCAYEANNNILNLDAGILTTDGVHLNDAGNKFAAEVIWNILKDM